MPDGGFVVALAVAALVSGPSLAGAADADLGGAAITQTFSP